jgi:hypothetical protein
MSVHPFARKCDEVIERLRDILANMKRAKKAAKDAGERPVRDRGGRPRGGGGVIQLGALASSQAERQGTASPGEANGLFSKQALRMRGDQTMKRLQEKYFRELDKCNRARRRATANGSQTLEDGSIAPAAGKRAVSLPCPGANSARRALDAYMTRTYGRVGANSGGGGGGGF